MTKELTLTNDFSEVVEYLPEHREMVKLIEDNYPEINRATSLFGKTQSQFMDNMLTVNNLSPMRNIRQILAEMEKTRNALREAYFNCKKKEIEIKRKHIKLESTKDELDKELLEVEILEIGAQLETTKVYISGAIRKLAAYTEQYNNIVENSGLKNFTEEDFEKDEEKHHIMKSFEQALCAARSRNGLIDEGNLIYLSQIGINGSVAQKEISAYLDLEKKLLNDNKEPTHKMQIMFLQRMVDKFQGSSKVLAESKGMNSILSKKALLKSGDTRLLLK